MASISKHIPLEADADTVWTALRDVGNAHQIFAPVLTDCRLDRDDIRVVTFANGMVVHEQIVDVDDDARRVAYTVLDGPFTHHHATFVVAAEPEWHQRARLGERPAAERRRPDGRRPHGPGRVAAQQAFGCGAKLTT